MAALVNRDENEECKKTLATFVKFRGHLGNF